MKIKTRWDRSKYSIQKAYAYTIRNGALVQYTGEFWHGYSGYTGRDYNAFVVANENNCEVKRIGCAATEGEVANRVVWLSEPNRTKAAMLLIAYERERINELEERIVKHEQLIETLTREMEEV